MVVYDVCPNGFIHLLDVRFVVDERDTLTRVFVPGDDGFFDDGRSEMGNKMFFKPGELFLSTLQVGQERGRTDARMVAKIEQLLPAVNCAVDDRKVAEETFGIMDCFDFLLMLRVGIANIERGAARKGRHIGMLNGKLTLDAGIKIRKDAVHINQNDRAVGCIHDFPIVRRFKGKCKVNEKTTTEVIVISW